MNLKLLLVLSTVLILMISQPYIYAAETTTPINERDITIIEKKVCFNVSVSDPITNETVTKTICVVIAFHIMNAKPSNDTINVEFPVTIHVGNRTITKKVMVPLKILGKVTRIEVKSVSGTGEEQTENVIIVAPQETTTTKTTTAHKLTTTTPKTPIHRVTATKTVTITRTVTKTQSSLAAATTTATPRTPSQAAKNIDPYTVLAVAVAITGAGVAAYTIKKSKREEKKEEKEEARRQEQAAESEKQDYIEAIKLLKQKLEEKQGEIEKLKKSFPYGLVCPSCGNKVKPIITEDNRLLCPICHAEIGRIKEDGTLELDIKEGQKSQENLEADK